MANHHSNARVILPIMTSAFVTTILRFNLTSGIMPIQPTVPIGLTIFIDAVKASGAPDDSITTSNFGAV